MLFLANSIRGTLLSIFNASQYAVGGGCLKVKIKVHNFCYIAVSVENPLIVELVR